MEHFSRLQSTCFTEKLAFISALTFYCATSMMRDTNNTLSRMSFFVRRRSPIPSKISSKIVNFVFFGPKYYIPWCHSFFIQNENVVFLIILIDIATVCTLCLHTWHINVLIHITTRDSALKCRWEKNTHFAKIHFKFISSAVCLFRQTPLQLFLT